MERIPTTANIIDFRKATANAKRIIIIDKKKRHGENLQQLLQQQHH